jgi:hypothetical protein
MNEDLEQDEQPIKKEIGEEIYWEYYEYEFQEKTADWFWILGTIAVLLIIISIILKNYLLGLIILLSAYILGTYAKRPPSLITYGLSHNGVKHGESIFRYDTIKSFWVNKNTNHLVIESTRMVKPHISIPLGDTDPELIRKKLLPILREQEYHGSFSDYLSDFFGF